MMSQSAITEAGSVPVLIVPEYVPACLKAGSVKASEHSYALTNKQLRQMKMAVGTT